MQLAPAQARMPWGETYPSRGQRVSYQGPVELVLVDAGPAPEAVAAVVRDVMGIHISDTRALAHAAPFGLYKKLDRRDADALSLKLKLAGAVVEIRAPRPPIVGIRSWRRHLGRA